MSTRDFLVRSRYRLADARAYARRHPGEAAARVLVLASMTLATGFFVLPLYWLFSAAVKPPFTIGFPPDPIPTAFSLRNFETIVTETAFIDVYFVNSLIVAFSTVVVVVLVATPAGYALSRYDLPYQRYLLVSILFVQMIPFLAMIIPLYRMFSVLGLLDTLVVIVLTASANTVPVATWLIKGYFDTVPDGLEEAARVGGASRSQAFRVIMPLAKPAIGAVGIYAFVGAWNQFIIPLTFTSSEAVTVFPVGLYNFISRRGVVNWGLLGAASVTAMVPVLVLFVTFQRQFVAGLTGSEFKG